MLYDMRCDECNRELEIGCPINEHLDIIVPGITCGKMCPGTMYQVIKSPSMIINREAFPATGNEVQLPTPHGEDKKFTDKIHAREWLGERGLTSKWIENDM